MTKITNNTASPYDLPGNDGPVRLPAFGSVEGEFSGEYLEILRASNVVSIEESSAKPKEKAPPQEAGDDIDTLRAEYKSLSGEDADKRWGEARLKAEIDSLLKA